MTIPMDHWNKVRIKTPPFLTMEYSPEERDDKIDKDMKFLCKRVKSLKIYLLEDHVHRLMNLESRFLRKLIGSQIKHRPEKFQSSMSMIARCVDRLKKQNLSDYVKRIQGMMPREFSSHTSIRAPTKDMFVCMLTKMYGAFKLLLTLVDYCKEAAYYLIAKLEIGHILTDASTNLAAVARLRALGLDICGHLCSAYDDIIQRIFQLKGSKQVGEIDEYFRLMTEFNEYCSNSKNGIKAHLLRGLPSFDILEMFEDSDDDEYFIKSDEEQSATEDLNTPVNIFLDGNETSYDSNTEIQNKKSKVNAEVMSLLDLLDDGNESVLKKRKCDERQVYGSHQQNYKNEPLLKKQKCDEQDFVACHKKKELDYVPNINFKYPRTLDEDVGETVRRGKQNKRAVETKTKIIKTHFLTSGDYVGENVEGRKLNYPGLKQQNQQDNINVGQTVKKHKNKKRKRKNDIKSSPLLNEDVGETVERDKKMKKGENKEKKSRPFSGSKRRYFDVV